MCPRGSKKSSRENFTFAIGNGKCIQEHHWIFDSGSSRHLVNYLSLMVDPEDYYSECLTAATDGGVLRVTKQEAPTLKLSRLELSKPYASSMSSTLPTSSKISSPMVSSRLKDSFFNIEERGAC